MYFETNTQQGRSIDPIFICLAEQLQQIQPAVKQPVVAAAAEVVEVSHAAQDVTTRLASVTQLLAELDSVIAVAKADVTEAGHKLDRRKQRFEEAQQTFNTMNAQLLVHTQRRQKLQHFLDEHQAESGSSVLRIEPSGDWDKLSATDPVSGKVVIMTPRVPLTALSVRVALVGEVELVRRFTVHPFLLQERVLMEGAEITRGFALPFRFDDVRTHETYSGTALRIRYLVRATIVRDFGTGVNLVASVPLHVMLTEAARERSLSIGAQLSPRPTPQGVEEQLDTPECRCCLRLEQAVCSLAGSVRASVVFERVQDISSVKLALYRAESWAAGHSIEDDCTNILVAPLIDRVPTVGTEYTVVLRLADAQLTPTVAGVDDVCSVRYFVNAVMCDADGGEVANVDTEVILTR
eukprot:TRINITY_DN498_c0_g2_i2.p2 TRINITY_DN498_c0_g2~~TRINITY_DN498_c0_g2_i2.p2  ORF type:complete len:408 (+),score=114.62 TRINITY_DN498_c0_g2_i2:545-1768(+)